MQMRGFLRGVEEGGYFQRKPSKVEGKDQIIQKLEAQVFELEHKLEIRQKFKRILLEETELLERIASIVLKKPDDDEGVREELSLLEEDDDSMRICVITNVVGNATFAQPPVASISVPGKVTNGQIIRIEGVQDASAAAVQDSDQRQGDCAEADDLMCEYCGGRFYVREDLQWHLEHRHKE